MPETPDGGTKPVYDDGSKVEIEIEPDDPPRSGEWADPEEIFETLTEDEYELGQFLGETIDLNDHTDNGLDRTW
jgi:hypothetical protein